MEKEYLECSQESRPERLCPKCKERERDYSLPYCKSCFAIYQKERRKNPEIKLRESIYKKEYRLRKKNAF